MKKRNEIRNLCLTNGKRERHTFTSVHTYTKKKRKVFSLLYIFEIFFFTREHIVVWNLYDFCDAESSLIPFQFSTQEHGAMKIKFNSFRLNLTWICCSASKSSTLEMAWWRKSTKWLFFNQNHNPKLKAHTKRLKAK